MKGLVALALLLCGCGQENLELLVPVEGHDRCRAFTSERQCQDNASLGCSFQPNEVGCLSTDPTCQPGQCRGGDPFVSRVQRSFFLNSSLFRFVGVSSWALLPNPSCSAVPQDEREAWITQAYDSLVASGTKVARVYAFQGAAGPTGDDFMIFDSSVRAARRAGVRLLLTFDHARGECSQGGARSEAWFAGGFRSPDGIYTRSYVDYAEMLATRYRSEPTVLGYTLMQSLGGAEPQTLSAFVDEVGKRVHDAAPNQLVSLDLYGDPTPSYVELQQRPVVDFVDVDDFDFAEPEEPIRTDVLDALAGIDKPAVIGEGAFQVDSDSADQLRDRASRARGRMEQWKKAGFAGALLWAYQPGWKDASEEFDGRATDPLLQPNGVVAEAPW